MNINGKVASAKEAFDMIEAMDDANREVGLEMAASGTVEYGNGMDSDEYLVLNGVVLEGKEARGYVELQEFTKYDDEQLDMYHFYCMGQRSLQ